MSELVWSSQARLDLALIDDQLYLQDPDFADRVALESVYAARFLLDWPYAGSLTGDRGHRKWPIKRTPYILIYTPDAGNIVILRVHHERQDWGADA